MHRARAGRRWRSGRVVEHHFHIEIEECRLPPCSHDTRPYDLRCSEGATNPSRATGRWDAADILGPYLRRGASALTAKARGGRRRGVTAGTVSPKGG